MKWAVAAGNSKKQRKAAKRGACLMEYTLVSSAGKEAAPTQPAGAPVWSRDVLQPLAPGALTPFSASVLHEMAGRSWFNYFDRLGFDPTPKSRVVRSRHGRPYFTLTLSAQLDAQQAGIEPPALRIGGEVRPLARWEKPGLLAGLKLGGNARKVAGVLTALGSELEPAATKGQAWLQRVQAMRWSQAEILQIMEEIERTGAGTLQLYVAARHSLHAAYLRLLGLFDGPASTRQLLALNAALRPREELVELQIARAIASLAQTVQSAPEVQRLLGAESFAAVEEEIDKTVLGPGLRQFLAKYGHRCAGEGELMMPRWAEDPAPVLVAVATAAAQGVTTLPPAVPADDGPLLALLATKQRKEAQALLLQAQQALVLQSKALHIHAYTLAGTRIWALAAGREAMGDQRLTDQNDVFLYELEEMKQMMTGEWNVSDKKGIQSTAARRRAEWQTAQQATASDLLVGDGEAVAAIAPGAAGLPGAPGAGAGPVVAMPAGLHNLAGTAQGAKVILAGIQADAGWALALPVAAGVLQGQGSPLDPFTSAASALQIPLVYDLGERLASFNEQSIATIDGSKGKVKDGK
jgi:pyruvate,water dikinase